ncbi:MAG TPA: asparagine synthase (glutamine-hydrolyzing) [Thermoanaerobaculia bacterium]|nr:asparagine synthase (glutamine-hydrolyzing) [Thermoanaerobaculia bacterium]
MCGITAIFAYGANAAPVDRDELEAITESMRPRGPDAGGTWISDDGRVGLGSRRLAIIDLSDEGTQPMFGFAGEVAIVFNGEIYNHRELRASLERGGAQFHSHTDTEVILQLWRRDGPAMLGLLRGMYAFAIYDTRVKSMFVARDPYGLKPLYFADDGRTIRLASEVKALLAGGAVSRAISPAGAAGFFLTGSVPEPFTIRDDVRLMEAGTSFTIDERGLSEPRTHLSIASVLRRGRTQRGVTGLTEPEIVFHERVEESIDHHLVSDVPVGVFLSAGIDSSALTSIAARRYGDRLRTFTLAFEEFRGSLGDEAPLAERFARELGTLHCTRIVTREEFRADLPKILAAMDQPTIDGVNTWFISKAVHEAGVKVALSGVGGDELFGGYPSFARIPKMTRLARSPLAPLVPMFSRHPKAKLIGMMGGTYPGAYFLQRGLFLPHELPGILGKELTREGLTRLDLLGLVQKAMTPDPGSPFARIAALEASLYMRNQLLRDTDWASMAHSVEVRTPLVDAALLRQLAPLLLETGRVGKEVLAARLPHWLRNRAKTGFFVPMREWADLPPDGTSTRMRSWARVVFQAFQP